MKNIKNFNQFKINEEIHIGNKHFWLFDNEDEFSNRYTLILNSGDVYVGLTPEHTFQQISQRNLTIDKILNTAKKLFGTEITDFETLPLDVQKEINKIII